MSDNFHCYVKQEQWAIQVLATRNGYQYSAVSLDTIEQLRAVRDCINDFLDGIPELESDSES